MEAVSQCLIVFRHLLLILSSQSLRECVSILSLLLQTCLYALSLLLGVLVLLNTLLEVSGSLLQSLFSPLKRLKSRKNSPQARLFLKERRKKPLRL